MNRAAAFLLMAGALGTGLPDLPEPRPEREPSPSDLDAIRRAKERRARIRARNLRNKERGE